MTAEAAWDDLNAALEHYTPGCTGHASFTADSRTDEQRAECSSICARCPLADLCNAYATAAKVDAGFWAGVERSPKRRRATESTTADRTASGNHQTEGRSIMSKSTPLSVQNAFNDKLKSSQQQTDAVKEAHRIAAQAIKDDVTLSSTGRRQKLDALNYDTKSRIAALKESLESSQKGLRDKVEKELRGSLPADPASVVSRRDAADRARKLDRHEALEVLQDAIAGNDADLAHAIGVKARNNGWVDVAEEWSASYSDVAGSAEALDYLDSNGPGTAGYNLFSSMTFNAPQD